MQRLDKNIINFDKLIDREPRKGLGMKIVPESSYDYKRAIDAKTFKVKPRNIVISNFDKQFPRDDSLYNQTDMYRNVILENTREERELEIKAKKEANRNYPSFFSP